MAAKIRLKKVGRRGQPSYRVVVLDGRKPRDAKVVADLGHYDPKTNPPTFEINGDEALKWLGEGAKATRAARIILSKAGVMAAWNAAQRGETIEIEKKELKPTVKPEKPKAEALAAEETEADKPEESTEEAAEAEAPAEEPEEEAAEAEAPAEEPAEEASDEEDASDEEKE